MYLIMPFTEFAEFPGSTESSKNVMKQHYLVCAVLNSRGNNLKFAVITFFSTNQ